MADSKHYNSKDLTQCRICHLTQHDPKVLPCLHSFCMKCLSQWAKGNTKVTCPLCAQEFGMPSGGVGAFRTNFFINTLKEREENARTIQSKDRVVPCACCASLKGTVEGYCYTCGGFICGDCVRIHGKIKRLSYHKVIPYADLQSGKSDIRNLHHDKHCKVHKEQVLRFFCETCGQLICLGCMVIDHPAASHTLVNLKNASKGQKTEIEQLTKKCKVVQDKIKEALKELVSISEELERNASTVEEEIDEAFHKALRSLENNRNRLKGEVKTIVLKRKRQIDTERDEIHIQQTRLDTTLQMATEVVQKGSDYDLALLYSPLKTNLTTLCDMKPARSKKNLGDVSFRPLREKASLNFGSVLSRCQRVKEGVGVWTMVGVFGKNGAGKLTSGRGVAITPQGDIAIADQSDPVIKLYTTNGHFKSIITHPNCPWKIAVSTDGTMFVTDGTDQVSLYGVDGRLKQQFPSKSPDNVLSTTDAQDSKLWGLAFDNHNNMLVGETNQMYISKHREDGSHIMSFKVTIQPYNIAVSPRGQIIISKSDTNNRGVHILSENGIHLRTLKPPSFWNPLGVCCTSDDEIYVADYTGIIHSFTETGDYIGCLTKNVRKPAGLALMDDENKLVVAEDKGVKIFELQ